MSPWLLNVYMDTVMKEVKLGIRRKEVRLLEDERERERERGDYLSFCMQITWFL